MIIPMGEMYPGETAEIVSIDYVSEGMRRIRDIGLREGKLIDLFHKDMVCSRKMVIGFDDVRVALDCQVFSAILVRPIRNSYEVLKTQAHYDSLTGCLNRHAMNDLFTGEYEKYCRERIPVSILMTDIDHFKRINDMFGHSIGDAVLKSVSALLKSFLRRSDSICRWGGEEFMIVLRGTLLQDAGLIAERLRLAVQERDFQPFLSRGELTVSIGSSSLPPDIGMSELFDRADRALYGAKQAGRNRVQLCGESL